MRPGLRGFVFGVLCGVVLGGGGFLLGVALDDWQASSRTAVVETCARLTQSVTRCVTVEVPVEVK